VSFAAITLYVASQRVFIIVSLYFVMTQSGNFWIHPRTRARPHTQTSEQAGQHVELILRCQLINSAYYDNRKALKISMLRECTLVRVNRYLIVRKKFVVRGRSKVVYMDDRSF